MKKDEIISVLRDLHFVTGFRVSLHSVDYTEIAAYPAEKCNFCRLVQSSSREYGKCASCDKEMCKTALGKMSTHIYTCRYGLTEAVSPLYNFGTLTGFLMMGQVRVDGREACECLPIDVGIDGEKLYSEIRAVDPEFIDPYVRIMTICAQYLTLSNLIHPKRTSIADAANKYIFENYHSRLTIDDICRELGCSKTTLEVAFKKQFGITVNKHINDLKLRAAENLITSGEKSVGEIASMLGYNDQSYFSKVFSARYGVPPSEYTGKEESEE